MSDAAIPPSTTATGATDSPTDAPWVWKLLTTPVSKVACGRVTGWATPQRVVAAVSLPPPLAALVLDVAKRSRLWRVEQAEIARELAAHFADGIDAGRSIDQLVTDFGDPAQAAALLRRAAKRNRPWPWRAMRFTVRAAACSFLALILIYGAMAFRFYLGRPGLIVDYRPELNAAAMAVKDEDRAWPLYREALLRLPKPNGESAMRFPNPSPEATLLTGERRFNRMPHPGEEGWEVVEAYLREAAPALQSARRAAEKRGLGLIVGYPWSAEDQRLWPGSQYVPGDDFTSPESDGVMGVLLPHLGSLRGLAMTLAWDVQQAAAIGDSATALTDLRSMFAIARHTRETSVLIGDLVSNAMFAMARERIDLILAQQPQLFSDQEWIALAHELAAFDDGELAVRVGGERTFFNDVLQRIYTDDGSGDGRITPHGLRWLGNLGGPNSETYDRWVNFGGPAMAAVVLGRREMAAEYDRLMNMLEAEAATPLWEREESRAEDILKGWTSPLERVRHLPLCMLMPAIGKATVSGQLSMLRRDATITAIALELHRRRHGGWPASLSELAPGMMPALPVDRFDGQTLRYAIKDGRPLLYSVGSNRVDDGGVLPPPPGFGARQFWAATWYPKSEIQRRLAGNAPLGSDGNVPSGDWILWPPLPEEPLRRESEPAGVSHHGSAE